MTPHSSAPAPALSPAEATVLVDEIIGLIDALEPVLAQETALTRTGHVADAAALQDEKAGLAARYMMATQRLKSATARSPATLAGIARRAFERHEKLRAALQLNMTVIATVHAVAEDLIRGAVAEVSKRNAPTVYGAGGRTVAPPAGKAGPIAVNRNC
ncbi:MAG: hypothetical protein J0H62_04825 [Rhizobiales bacterium]|nr:hypothetical protein [Hyphomicrobiales bacterium]